MLTRSSFSTGVSIPREKRTQEGLTFRQIPHRKGFLVNLLVPQIPILLRLEAMLYVFLDKGQRLIRLYAPVFMKINVFEGGRIMDGGDG